MLFWTITLIIVLIILIFIKLLFGLLVKKNLQREPKRVDKPISFVEKYLLSDYSMQALIGVIATILGVTLGLHLSNTETQKNNLKTVNQLLSLTYNDISRQLAEYNLFYDENERKKYNIETYDILKDYLGKKPASIDFLLDSDLSRNLLHHEIYMQMLDIRTNLYLNMNNANHMDCSEETELLREAELINLYYEYFQRNAYLAFLYTTKSNTIDDIFLLMRTNNVWFISKLGEINGMEEQEAFNSAVLIYMEAYPDRLTKDDVDIKLELGAIEYPKWLILKDS